jgi:hypothetical protein
MRYIDKIVRVQALASLSQLEDYAANDGYQMNYEVGLHTVN